MFSIQGVLDYLVVDLVGAPVAFRQSLSADHTFLKVLGKYIQPLHYWLQYTPVLVVVVVVFDSVLSGHCYTDCTSGVIVSLLTLSCFPISLFTLPFSHLLSRTFFHSPFLSRTLPLSHLDPSKTFLSPYFTQVLHDVPPIPLHLYLTTSLSPL